MTHPLRLLALLFLLLAAACAGPPPPVAPSAEPASLPPAEPPSPPPVVMVAPDAGLETLEPIARAMLDEPPSAGAPSASPEAPPPPPPAPPSDDEALHGILAGIHPRSATERDVSPQARDLLFEHLPAVTRTVRITPSPQDQGVTLRGIKPGDVMSALGFRNGDMLIAVAGRPVYSPEKALEAYAAVRSAAKVVVRIKRGGAPVDLTFRLAP
jgi:hypothetical protein